MGCIVILLEDVFKDPCYLGNAISFHITKDHKNRSRVKSSLNPKYTFFMIRYFLLGNQRLGSSKKSRQELKYDYVAIGRIYRFWRFPKVVSRTMFSSLKAKQQNVAKLKTKQSSVPFNNLTICTNIYLERDTTFPIPTL